MNMGSEERHNMGLPPGPRSFLSIGIFREMRRDPLAYLTKLTRVYGDVCSFRSIGQRYLILNHPDLAREVLLTQADAFWKGPALQNSKGILGEGLLTAEGETHRQQRRLIQPSFHARHVETYAPDIIESTRDLLEKWGRCGMRGAFTVDIRPEVMGLTLVIAGKTLFGAMLEKDVATVHRCMDDLMNNYVRAVVPWGKLLNRLPLKSTVRLAKAQADLRGVVERMIKARRGEMAGGMLRGHVGAQKESVCPFAAEHGTRAPEDGTRRDLLSTMIAATDPEAVGDGGRGRMTDEQLRDQAITILTASHETTANAMTFTLHLLAQHPKEQEKLCAEVAGVAGDAETPTLEMVDRLSRTRWVLSESMRLFPPAWTLGRQNQREIELGGYRIPRKCTVLIPQWTLHRDGRFWEEPLAFRPERWEQPRHPRFAYIPFSTGARNCIGESFAWLEMTLALAMLVRRFSFRPAESAAEELKLVPAITLRPRNAIHLVITPRG
jgi:cytochrome P450